MNLLVDTHVAIWSVADSARIPLRIRALLADGENRAHVSPVSIWEIAVKHRLGKPSAPAFNGRDATRFFAEAGFRTLPLTEAHAAAVDDLPSLHGDPFDRLLIAQALSEPMRFITGDRQLAAYSDTVIWW